jgi:predicted CoA-substrate-specific enzyme activase
MSRTVGICVGAVTLSVAEDISEGIAYHRIPHDGKVAEALDSFLSTRPDARVGVTGQKYRKMAPYPSVPEPEAVELAFGHIGSRYPNIDTIVSAGAETFLAYSMDRSGRIRAVHTGSKCAAGTGEFFLQQVRRMGLTAEEAVRMAADQEPYRVASRCSVFCKSDCTHALNKGVDRGRVAAGLSRMLSGKVTELLATARAQRVLLIGGVSRNRLVVDYVQKEYPDTFVPEEAACFEALGALLWARQNGSKADQPAHLEISAKSSYQTLPSLEAGPGRVTFLDENKGEYYNGEYVLGLDVGSTTTKAVLMRADDRTVVSDVYLRTEGEPVNASRSCYQELHRQLPGDLDPVIVGLGVTGSGRQIGGLHALTQTVVNEIMAHARAAVHYDPSVETIFEIGGQDAKYTFLTNGVPVDYAMNEACSAGTGSFLEESCFESFGLDTRAIAGIALKGMFPPDFNDQCSAFIASDIKTAIHEGMEREDIVAGLVYSVCRNYLSRVRGNRWTGAHIFMQGGVCYNRSVPLAMANLCGAEVTVPPRPGLMGAFGAALETLNRIETGAVGKKSFNLLELADRELVSRRPFTCEGGPQGCDRKCDIIPFEIDGRLYPFGGACDRYNGTRRGIDGDTGSPCNGSPDTSTVDLVRIREEMVFGNGAQAGAGNGRLRVGIPGSLLTNTFYPLYAGFMEDLGFEVVRGVQNGSGGQEKAGSAFCHPVLQSHSHLQHLVDEGVDWIFSPHVRNIPLAEGDGAYCTCPLVQAEPYVLDSAFKDDVTGKLVTCVLDLDDPGSVKAEFESVGRQLGVPRRKAVRAFDRAWSLFKDHEERMLRTGRGFMEGLGEGETAVVLFGRSYNAFPSQANMGIPGKFASRGYPVVPYDMIPLPEGYTSPLNRMYWASGQAILQAARYVRATPGLFGVYITSFSCGPDSFILEKYREIMGDKPYLVLELDTHTSDAGLDTRVEAFLDVAANFSANGTGGAGISPSPYTGSEAKEEKGPGVPFAAGSLQSVFDPNVKILVPSMGHITAKGIAASLRHSGIKAESAPPPGPEELNLGKGSASCRECLPYLLTTGSLKRYVRDRNGDDERLLYLMPEADGPCRFGQYGQALEGVVQRDRLGEVGIFSPSSNNSYSGLPESFNKRCLLSFAITDGLADIRAGVLTLAEDPGQATQVLDRAEDSILESLASDEEAQVFQVLGDVMSELSTVERKRSLQEVTKVLLTGEIYVRREAFSSYDLVERLAREEILVKTSPVLEWVFYIDHIVLSGLLKKASLKERVAVGLRNIYSRRMTGKVQRVLETSNFYQDHPIDIRYLIQKGRELIDPRLTGEAILTVSSTLSELGDDVHGVISVSPFGCMPGRIAESIISQRLEEDKHLFSRQRSGFWKKHRGSLPLPFLALETDGNPLSQMIETKLDSFVMSAHRLKQELKKVVNSER